MKRLPLLFLAISFLALVVSGVHQHAWAKNPDSAGSEPCPDKDQDSIKGMKTHFALLAKEIEDVAVKGSGQLQQDVQDDAPNHFANVRGKSWQLTYLSNECVDLVIRPEGAFQVTRSSANGVFQAKLLNPSLLVAGDGFMKAIKFALQACPKVVGPAPDGSVEFPLLTPLGVPISYDDLRTDPKVSGLSLSWEPRAAASFTKSDGNILKFKRSTGQGNTPIKVTVKWNYDGDDREVSGNLPVLDDGYHETQVTKLETYTLNTGSRFDDTTGSSISDARTRFKSAMIRKLTRLCNLQAANLKSNPPGDTKVISVTDARFDQDDPTNADMFEMVKPFCHAHHENGDTDFVCEGSNDDIGTRFVCTMNVTRTQMVK